MQGHTKHIIAIAVFIAVVVPFYLFFPEEEAYSKARESIQESINFNLSQVQTAETPDIPFLGEQRQEQYLFSSASFPVSAEAASDAVRNRIARVNTHILDTIKMNLEAEHDTHQTVLLNLFPDRTLVTVMNQVERKENGYVLKGSVEDGETVGTAVFTVTEDGVTGTISPLPAVSEGIRSVHISPLSDDGRYVLIEEMGDEV